MMKTKFKAYCFIVVAVVITSLTVIVHGDHTEFHEGKSLLDQLAVS